MQSQMQSQTQPDQMQPLQGQPQWAQQGSPQPGDILLFANAQGLNLVTTFVTHSPYYHVGIYAGDAHVVEMRTFGVICRDMRGEDGGHYFVAIPAPEGRGREALAWAYSKMDSKYDDRDIVLLLLNRIFLHLHLNYTPRGEYTCGEFVAAAFDVVGVQLFPDLDLPDVEPADFSRFVPDGAPVQTFYRKPT